MDITVEISHAQCSGGPGRECSPSYFLLFGTWLNIYSAIVLWCLLSFNFFSLQDSLKNLVSEFPDTNLHLLSPLKQSIYRSYMLGRAASWGKHLEASQDAEFISQEGWSHRKKKKKNHFSQLWFQPGKMCQARSGQESAPRDQKSGEAILNWRAGQGQGRKVRTKAMLLTGCKRCIPKRSWLSAQWAMVPDRVGLEKLGLWCHKAACPAASQFQVQLKKPFTEKFHPENL